MRQQPSASRTRPRRVSLVVAAGVIVGLVIGAGCSSGTTSGTTSGPSTSATSPVTEATSSVPTTSSSTSVPPTTPSTSRPTTSTSAAPPTTVAGKVPRAVSVILAAPGGGTGEVVVDWNAVAGATGYHMDRAITATGPWDTVAEFSVITGHATVAADVTNLWSTGYMYVPATGAGSLPDRSPSFEYVEYPVTTTHCFRVFAVNAAGRSPASVVVCSGPPG